MIEKNRQHYSVSPSIVTKSVADVISVLNFVRSQPLKASLHRNANAACENDVYVYVGKFVDCWAFAEAANRPYINVLYANSL